MSNVIDKLKINDNTYTINNEYVSYNEQEFSKDKKAIARDNIGATSLVGENQIILIENENILPSGEEAPIYKDQIGNQYIINLGSFSIPCKPAIMSAKTKLSLGVAVTEKPVRTAITISPYTIEEYKQIYDEIGDYPFYNIDYMNNCLWFQELFPIGYQSDMSRYSNTTALYNGDNTLDTDKDGYISYYVYMHIDLADVEFYTKCKMTLAMQVLHADE